MRKTKKMIEVEKRLGTTDLRATIIQMVNDDDLTLSEIADNRLGISKASLGYWLLKMDIQVKKVAIHPTERVVIVPMGKRVELVDA